MNALIETLNRWGEAALPFAGQVLWQSSLLIVVLLALDLLLRHRIRAGFRYALWMLLLVKLVLPPSLALPTGAGYWIERGAKPELAPQPTRPVVVTRPPEISYVDVVGSTFDFEIAPAAVESTPKVAIPPRPALTRDGRLLATWLAGTIVLLGWMLGRWRWVNRLVRASEPAPAELQALLASVCRTSCPTPSVLPAACRQTGRDRRSARSGEAAEVTTAPETEEAPLNAHAPDGALGETRPTLANVLPAACPSFPHTDWRRDRERKGDTPVAQSQVEATGVSPFRFLGRLPACPALRLTDTAMSPAVCGLLRPVILLPRKLVGTLSREQLGTVLLHELIHLRRRDLWVNCAQTLLQIAAWWHPLLWMANARIRRVREEAVDEAVACALRDDADAYPATLLEVAKLTFTRPLMTLGLVGILESKSALKQRIRRLLELPPLESTRLKWWQWAAVGAVAFTALPMAEGQQSTDRTNSNPVDVPANADPKPTDSTQMETREFRVNPVTFYQSLERISESLPPHTNANGVILKGSQAFRSATEADGMHLVHHFVRAYFEKLGVKLDPPKAAFVNERKAILLVRATIEDLEIVQRAVEALNTEPPQITLEVRVVEVPIEDQRAPMFNWILPAGLGEVKLSEASSANNPMAILTDPQFRVIIKAFEQRTFLKWNFGPRVTTLSGHTTELKLRDTPLIVAPKFGPQFDKLEVNPYALVDRENLQLTIIATIRARMVDDRGKGSPHAYFVSQKASTAAMKTGETIVLAVSAGLEDTERNDGNLQTLVFITPTIIDPAPAGNPMRPAVRLPNNHGQVEPTRLNTSDPDKESRSTAAKLELSPPHSLDSTNLTELGRQMITAESPLPDPRFKGYRPIGLEPRFVLVPVEGLTRALNGRLPLARPLIIASNELAVLTDSLIEAGAVDHSAAEPLKFSQMSGGVFHWQVARGEPSQVQFQVEDQATTNQIVFGARHGVAAFVPDWVPLTLLARPFANDDGSLHCLLSLATGEFEPSKLAKADESIPFGAALVWASTNEVRPGFAQVVVLKNSGEPKSNDARTGNPGAKPAATAPVAQTLEMAKALIVVGQLDEAERIVRDAARVDPDNSEIAYYLDRIQQLRSDRSQPAPGSNSSAPGRHTILEKLNKITLDQLHFDGLSLVEVIKELSDEARRLDPDGKGINFMIVGSDMGAFVYDAGSTENKNGRQQFDSHFVPADISGTIIDIKPPLRNLRLIDALNVIVMAADRRIQFTIEEFAVIFTAKPPEKEPLETREFRVHPQAFHRVLKFGTNLPPPSSILTPVTPGGGVRFLTTTNDMSVINAAVLRYFESLGVSLTPPKALFFNDRKGLLLVRSTLEDLEIIQRAIEALIPEPPQIQLEVRTADVTKDDVRALGFDWFVNPFSNDPASTTNVVTGILTDRQFEVVWKTLEQRPNPNLQALPQSTTVSGRPTRLRDVQSTNVVTGVTNTVAGHEYRKEDVEVGTTVFLSPFVLEDGDTIDLVTQIGLVQFLGYDDPAKQGLPPHILLPHFNRQSTRQSAKVRSGQTLVFGGMTSEHSKVAKDKVPLLSDLPLIGRMFRHEKQFMEMKQVLVFITPTIIDPAGNPVRHAEEPPFTTNPVPSPSTEP